MVFNVSKLAATSTIELHLMGIVPFRTLNAEYVNAVGDIDRVVDGWALLPIDAIYMSGRYYITMHLIDIKFSNKQLILALHNT